MLEHLNGSREGFAPDLIQGFTGFPLHGDDDFDVWSEVRQSETSANFNPENFAFLGIMRPTFEPEANFLDSSVRQIECHGSFPSLGCVAAPSRDGEGEGVKLSPELPIGGAEQ